MSRKAISDMLITCKSAAYNLAETNELREDTLKAGHDCAKDFRQLLIAILDGNGAADMKQTLPIISRKIAHSVTELVNLAKRLKGNISASWPNSGLLQAFPFTGSDWVDPNDPTVIAEKELLGAAASIDAAAEKLANLRPRQNIKVRNCTFVSFSFSSGSRFASRYKICLIFLVVDSKAPRSQTYYYRDNALIDHNHNRLSSCETRGLTHAIVIALSVFTGPRP